MLNTISKKGYKSIDSLFDGIEFSGDFRLTIFFGNRILEKNTGNDSRSILIQIYTLKRILNSLILLDDKISYEII